jgi:hypothetical protein
MKSTQLLSSEKPGFGCRAKDQHVMCLVSPKPTQNGSVTLLLRTCRYKASHPSQVDPSPTWDGMLTSEPSTLPGRGQRAQHGGRGHSSSLGPQAQAQVCAVLFEVLSASFK